jgi:iron complex outermembrane receptor protein
LTAAVDWAPGDAFDLRAEIRQIGPAVDLAPDGSEARLPPATEINLRFALPVVRFAGGRQLSLTAAADNLTDALIVPQLGLPLPGRTLRFGFRVE